MRYVGAVKYAITPSGTQTRDGVNDAGPNPLSPATNYRSVHCPRRRLFDDEDNLAVHPAGLKPGVSVTYAVERIDLIDDRLQVPVFRQPSHLTDECSGRVPEEEAYAAATEDARRGDTGQAPRLAIDVE